LTLPFLGAKIRFYIYPVIEPKGIKEVMKLKFLQEYAGIALPFENLDGKVDFEDIFGRSGPVHIEIGTGKGAFLLSQARTHPENNYLGIEWTSKYYRFSVDRMGRWGMRNVRLIRADASVLVQAYFRDMSVSCFHVYFPDPWPKNYQHKRRFFSDANLVHLLRCLVPGGTINLATDHEHYFQQMSDVLNRAFAAGTMEPIDFIRPVGAAEGEIVGTNYERKYKKEGRKTYTQAARKK
jgi:tRNA (guanine-N7-)-methyltransferase